MSTPANAPHVVQVDLDERAFLFPAGKSVSQLILTASGNTVSIDLTFPFNQTRLPPRLAVLDVDDAAAG